VVAGRFRVGLRVAEVAEAAQFYRGLGFDEVGSVPTPEGVVVMTILEREGVQLIVDAAPADGLAAARESWFGSS
jgi:hypothetical protein